MSNDVTPDQILAKITRLFPGEKGRILERLLKEAFQLRLDLASPGGAGIVGFDHEDFDADNVHEAIIEAANAVTPGGLSGQFQYRGSGSGIDKFVGAPGLTYDPTSDETTATFLIVNQIVVGADGAGLKSVTFHNGQTLNLRANPTASRNIDLPDASGTVALLSDLPSPTPASPGGADRQFQINNSAAFGGGQLFSLSNGALSYHFPDNDVAGGNARGAGAIDLQSSRAVANQVSSGSASFIGGGVNNRASGDQSAVTSGFDNVASGSHSAVVGGATNTASGSHSAVVGGATNTASGSHSAIAAGFNNAASGDHSAVVGGAANAASGNSSAVAGGNANAATGGNSFIVGGANNQTSQLNAVCVGGAYGSAYLNGQISFGRFPFGTMTPGTGQTSSIALRGTTADATPVDLLVGTQGSSKAELPNNTIWRAEIRLLASTNTTGAKFAEFTRKVLIRRGANAAATALVGSVQTIGTDIGSNSGSPPAGWAVAITADTTNGAMNVAVTGEAATNIRWLAEVQLVEIRFPD